MPSKSTKTTKSTRPVKSENESRSTSLFEYLRFGESYTSLVLGIIVVIISTVLLLSFVNNRNVEKDTPQLLSQKDIALPSSPITTETPGPDEVKATNTPAPTKEVVNEKVVTPTKTPTKAPIVSPTKAPKAVPTKTQEPTKIVANTATNPEKIAQGGVNPINDEYTVVAGDNLWSIAEKQYKSGYNWVDIARVNKLSNPRIITSGQKLKLPKVEQKIATVSTQPKQEAAVQNATKITGDSYIIVKGDTLWAISVRAYGDGYQWKKIASANNLINPSLIHSGNKLKIPRG